MKVKNFGFIQPKIETREEGAEHILGAEQVINPSGVWDWGAGERQQRNGVETFACTVFGILRAISTLIKFKTGISVNYSERYLANVAKFKGILNPNVGADPHRVIELVRNVAGCLKDERLPWSNDIKSAEDFYDVQNLAELMKEGPNWYNEWELRHNWVWSGWPSPEVKQRLLKEALKQGTVCVSVVAWKERNGLYYKEVGEQDGHWTGLERYDGETPIIEDSYPESEGDFEKILEPNYDFGIAKVFYLSPAQPKLSILQKILSALGEILNIQSLIIKKTIFDKLPVPSLKISRISDWAKQIQICEGYGTARAVTITQNFNPGAIKGSDGLFKKFNSYEEGFAYLCSYLTRACKGEHLAYPLGGETTLNAFTRVYVGNDFNYAPKIAAGLGILVETKIKELL